MNQLKWWTDSKIAPFILLINVKMLTNVGILTFIGRKNFKLNCIERKKSCITFGPDLFYHGCGDAMTDWPNLAQFHSGRARNFYLLVLPGTSIKNVLTKLLRQRKALITFILFNPFMPNGISHCYLLDQSFSVLRVVGWIFFHFYSNLDRIIWKQTLETRIRVDRRCILRSLVWVCTVCIPPTKRMLGLYGLNWFFLQHASNKMIFYWPWICRLTNTVDSATTAKYNAIFCKFS